MKLMKKGAEADIFESTWNGQKSIIKVRKEKDYRNPILDSRLRKQRTLRESEIMAQVKSIGIPSPLVYFVDAANCSLIMQKIDGTPLHDMPDSKIIAYCKKVGSLVGQMHKNGLMHGDLTTSNFIVSKNKIYVIDFGLSQKTIKPEDYAVDLRLIKEILNSAHAKIMEKAWKNFLSGYKNAVGPSTFAKITKLVSVIESRGRYATVI